MIDFTQRLSRLSNGQLSELSNRLVQRGDGRDQLVAFVVASGSVEEQDLRTFCKQCLPDYMLPQRIEWVDELPMTTTGKVDYRQLREVLPQAREQQSRAADTQIPGEPEVANGAHEASYTSVVSRLTEIWCDVLQMDRILPGDDYFELGGDSISNMQIIARCAKFDIHFGPSDLLQNPTIELLARWLQHTTIPTGGSSPLQAEPRPDKAIEPDTASVDDDTRAEMLRVLNLGRDS